MPIKYSIIYVSDMEQSVAFYRDVVGMPPDDATQMMEFKGIRT